MVDDYQIRKELDQYKWLFDELKNALESKGVYGLRDVLSSRQGIDELDEAFGILNKDLTKLDTDLDKLLDSLYDFNEGLIEFDDDNTNLKTDLTKLKENLLDFLDVLGLLDVDLTELSTGLSQLQTEVQGTGQGDGFLDYVQSLQTYIYGGTGYSMENPSPTSLKGKLDSFSDELADLSEGDTKLALTLSALSGYLTTFQGTISEFRQQIIADMGQSFYDGLDDQIIQLIGAITSANADISDHTDLINEVQSTIGEEGDTGNDGTLFGLLHDTDATATSASNSASQAISTYTNTVSPALNQIQNTDIPNVKSKMGYNSIPNNQTLQGQITFHNGEISDINGKMGTVPSGQTLQGQIDDNALEFSDFVSDVGDLSDLDGDIVSNLTSANSGLSDLKTDLYGSNQNPSSAQEGSIKANANQVGVINGKIGTVPSGQTLQGQITSHDGEISDINGKMGTVPDGKTLQGQIGNVPSGKNLQGQIGTVPSGKTLQGQIGTVPANTTLQGQITSHGNTIGTTSDTGNNTIFGLINQSIDSIDNVIDDIGDMTQLSSNVVDTISAVKGDVSDVQRDIGDVPTGQTLQGQITTHNGEITGLQGDVSDIQGDIGDVPSGQTLQGQINAIKSVIQNNNENQAIWVINENTPNQQEWLILMCDYAVDIDNIHYCYSLVGHKAFVRNRSTWEVYDIEQLNEEVDFICGISYNITGNLATVTSYETWDLMLSAQYDVFYVKENNRWVATNTEYPYARNSVYALTDWLSGSFTNIQVGENKSQHRINREIDAVFGDKANTSDLQTWTSITLNTYATLYVNETIHLCHLHYNRSFTSASADTFYTWHTALIPSEYRPSVQVQGSMNQIGSLIVNGGGDILGKFGIAWSSSRTVAGDCWWHY